MTVAIEATRWGCTTNPDRRKPKHLLDHELARVTGELVALCGEFLHYIDGATDVRPGDLCSGASMVADRERSCRTCLRREAERVEVNSLVLVPVTAVAQLASASPSVWHTVLPTLPVAVVSTVNSLL